MTTLPPSTDFTDNAVTEAVFKTSITDLREYLNDMFGADSLTDKLPWKNSVQAATTGDITLFGEQTIDDESLVTDDRCGVFFQTDATENGIYDVKSTAWIRAIDMQNWGQVPSALVVVDKGTINADKIFQCTSDDGGTIDSTGMDWIDLFVDLVGLSDTIEQNNLIINWNHFL